MNYRQALAHPHLDHLTSPRMERIAREVLQTLMDACPRKPFDRETAKSMLSMNDVDGLVAGDHDLDADMPWLTSEVLRILWNSHNRLVGKVKG